MGRGRKREGWGGGGVGSRGLDHGPIDTTEAHFIFIASVELAPLDEHTRSWMRVICVKWERRYCIKSN